jgi:hypothetical protein
MTKEGKLFDDVLYAMSMYFAAALKTELLHYDADIPVLILLCSLFGLHHYIERILLPRTSSFMHVLLYIISRTIAFLILSFTLHLMQERTWTTDLFWMESVVLPCIVLFIGVTIVQYRSYI